MNRLGAVLLFATHSIAAALDLTFPTKKRALLQGDGEGFDMFIDRDFQSLVPDCPAVMSSLL